MAGGKETPRQKMIGMMYMVLTALLALNVSSAIIEKFVIIDDTLVKLEHAADSSNAKLLLAIQKGTTAGPSVDTAKRKAILVRELTKNTITFLDNVKRTMVLVVPPAPPRFLKTGEVIAGPGGKDLEGEDYNLDSHRPEEFFLGDAAKKTVGAEFQGTLDKYVKQMNVYVGEVMATKPTLGDSSGTPLILPPVKTLTRIITDFPEFKEEAEKESTHKEFLEFSFQNVPLPAAIAYISELQAEILENEKVMLNSLKTITSVGVVEVDQLVPMLRAESNTVVYRQFYEADMFLAGSPSGGKAPEMYAGTTKLPVDKYDVGKGVIINRGKVKIQATANNFVNNIAEQSFSAKIVIPGRKEPAQLDMKFKVLKPNAKVGSVTGIQMFRDCGNEVEVTVPGMTDLSGIQLSLPPDQGIVQRTAKAGTFLVIPSRNTATLSINLDGLPIGTEPVPKVQNVPAPFLVIRQNNKDVKSPTLGTINLIAKAGNELFEGDKYGKDNQFIIQSFKYSINNGPVNTVSTQNWNLGSVGARPGDNIELTNFVVVRKDYAGSVKPVNVSNMDAVIKIKR